LVQSLPRRGDFHPCRRRAERMRYPSSLISCSHSGPAGAFTSAASCGLTRR
jgi:hypothetical protein